MISTTMIPLTNLTENAESIFRHLGENDGPLVVSVDGCPAAVIQDYEHYEKIRRGIDLWKTLSYRIRNAEHGNTLSLDEAFDEIEMEVFGVSC